MLKMVSSYLAVLVASVVAFVIGFLWYSPLLFGRIWIKLMGFSKNEIRKAKNKNMTLVMILGFLSTVVMAYFLNYLINSLGYTDAVSGGLIGFIVWLGFLATTMLGSVLWEGKPFSLYLINTTHHLVNYVVMGAILGWMA